MSPTPRLAEVTSLLGQTSTSTSDDFVWTFGRKPNSVTPVRPPPGFAPFSFEGRDPFSSLTLPGRSLSSSLTSFAPVSTSPFSTSLSVATSVTSLFSQSRCSVSFGDSASALYPSLFGGVSSPCFGVSSSLPSSISPSVPNIGGDRTSSFGVLDSFAGPSRSGFISVSSAFPSSFGVRSFSDSLSVSRSASASVSEFGGGAASSSGSFGGGAGPSLRPGYDRTCDRGEGVPGPSGVWSRGSKVRFSSPPRPSSDTFSDSASDPFLSDDLDLAEEEHGAGEDADTDLQSQPIYAHLQELASELSRDYIASKRQLKRASPYQMSGDMPAKYKKV